MALSSRFKWLCLPDQDPGGKIALWTCDPGGTTGYARAVIRTRMPSGKKTGRISKLDYLEQLEAWEEKRQPLATGIQLVRDWEKWSRRMYDKHKAKGVLVMENFNLAPGGAFHQNVLLPVVALSAARTCSILELGADYIVQQQPSLKANVDNDRLKEWGMYVVGKEHARDAVRHFAVRAARYL